MILEGLRYSTKLKQFNVNFKEDIDSDVISLSFASNNVLKTGKFYNHNISYGYKLNKEVDKSIRETVIGKLKYLDNVFKTIHEQTQFIRKPIERFDFTNKINTYDVIISPKSKSKLLEQMLLILKSKANTNVIFSTEDLIKNEISDIHLDYIKFLKTATSEDEKKRRIKLLDDAKKNGSVDGEFRIRKIYGQFRKLFSNFLKFKTENDRRLFNALGGNVLFIDDIFTTGETIKEAIRQLELKHPKKIDIFVFLNNK